MNKNYINIYNNLVYFSRNKKLYEYLTENDTFSDRLTMLLFHFCFFLKRFKIDENMNEMQQIHDYFFRQLELSVREIGYGDASINKKMKNYVNFFYDLLSKIDKWDHSDNVEKSEIISKYFKNVKDVDFFKDYFDNYWKFLIKSTLNSFLKGVIKANF
tara:strand:- start:976 stop:1449 length:474 start_codon:yes stop_codon:yes gene_type:complete